MKNAFRTYSQILQLRGETIHGLLQSDQGIAFALKLFLIVSLIAGLGFWFGVPAALRTPTAVERFDQFVADARETVATAVAAAESAVAAVQGEYDKAVAVLTARFEDAFAGIQAQVDALVARFAGPQARLDRLLAQTRATVDEVQAVVEQVKPTAQQLNQLLAISQANEAETQRLLAAAGITPGQLAAVRTEAQSRADATMAELQPMLDRLGMSKAQFDAILAQLSATPEQVNAWIKSLSTTPAWVGDLLAAISATPERLNELAAQIRAELVKMEPPLGERPSRIVRLGGRWVASPLHYAADWMLFVLALLVVAKSVGGKATLSQHLGAVALSAAPAIFFLFAYAPDMSNVLPAPTAVAIHETGRILALIGVVWCGVLLLKTLSVAHGMGLWKSAGVVVLTWVALYVVLPLAMLFATGFLLG